MKTITFLAGLAMLGTSGAALAQPGASERGQRSAAITRDQAVQRADQRFARLDINRDGRLTREEAQQGRAQLREQRNARRAERLANLTPERRARVEQRMAQRAERQERRTERQAGRTGERQGFFGAQGFVTQEQFRDRALRRFARLDVNSDGTVTREERREARQQLRQRMQERRQGRG